MVKKHLINNDHKLKLLFRPDASVGPREEEAVKSKLNAIKAALTEDEKKSIVQEAFKLKEHQERLQD